VQAWQRYRHRMNQIRHRSLQNRFCRVADARIAMRVTRLSRMRLVAGPTVARRLPYAPGSVPLAERDLRRLAVAQLPACDSADPASQAEPTQTKKRKAPADTRRGLLQGWHGCADAARQRLSVQPHLSLVTRTTHRTTSFPQGLPTRPRSNSERCRLEPCRATLARPMSTWYTRGEAISTPGREPPVIFSL
jgi:hypothetical protein